MISFRPQCTFPTAEPSGFVYGPDIRSTLDIVWSCASIIILSTWSVLHLTVPPDIKARTKLQSARKLLYFLQRKLSWMGIMLMFPEYLLAIGFANRIVSSQNTLTLEMLAEKDEVTWSRIHTIQADMGGIAVRFSDHSDREISDHSDREISDRQDRKPSEPSDSISPKGPIGASKECDQLSKPTANDPMIRPVDEGTDSKEFIEHTVSISRTSLESGGVPKFIEDFQKSQKRILSGLGETSWAPFHRHVRLASEYATPVNNAANIRANHLAPLHGNIWILDSKQLAVAREHGIIQKLPSIEMEDILDRSKSDGLVRILAVVQVLWLVVQMIARRIAHIPSSALEFSTLAFCTCAFMIYLIEWNKPKDVTVPNYIDTDAVVSPESFKAIVEAAPTVFMRNRRYYMPQSCVHQVIEGHYSNKHLDALIVFTSIFTTTLFGGIHLAAWSLEFPTTIEQLLWRIAALSVAIVPSICALIVLVESQVFGTTNRMSKMVVFIFGPLYISSRWFLIVESFRSLYFLPPETFIATWAINAPHIG